MIFVGNDLLVCTSHKICSSPPFIYMYFYTEDYHNGNKLFSFLYYSRQLLSFHSLVWFLYVFYLFFPHYSCPLKNSVKIV